MEPKYPVSPDSANPNGHNGRGAPIRVVVADDVTLDRVALTHLIASWPEFRVVGETVTTAETADVCRRLSPDVVVMSLILPSEAANPVIQLRQEVPGQKVIALAERINQRFGREGYQPIYLRIEHHEPQDVITYYRGADFCIVSSLHDGMNLVAKEFVAARDDEQGVLILSEFTGAATELPEALIVNPYNIDQCAAALHLALTMPPTEQRARMRSMRGIVQEFNVYRWAGRMLMDAARMRQRARLIRQVGLRDIRTITGDQA